MKRDTTKSCENCRWLSPAVSIEFKNGVAEERVVCMKGLWRQGSVTSISLYHNSDRYKEKAKRCVDFHTLVLVKISVDKPKTNRQS